MFDANVLFPFEIYKETLSKLQCNSLSSILTNIYFHDLDLYIEKNIIGRYKQKIKLTKCRIYEQMVSLTSFEKKTNSQIKKHILRRKRREATINGRLFFTDVEKKEISIKYLRHTNTILMGIKGSKALAKKIFKIVTFFLKSNLQLNLNEEKSQILNSFSNKIPFLGMLLYNVYIKKIFNFKTINIGNKKRKRLRIANRIKSLKHKQTKLFKNECLNFLRKSYNKYHKNKIIVKKNFLCLIKRSVIFESFLYKSNRTIYQEFIKNLQKISEIKENSKIVTFLKL
jgi:hypothetical protein